MDLGGFEWQAGFVDRPLERWLLALQPDRVHGDDFDYDDDDDDDDNDDDDYDFDDDDYGHLVGSDKSISVWGDKTVKPISNLNNS